MLLLLIKVFNEKRQEAIINLILVEFLWNFNQYTFGKHLLASSKKEKS